MQKASHTVTDVTLRKTIDDLRNLSGVIASARHFLCLVEALSGDAIRRMLSTSKLPLILGH